MKLRLVLLICALLTLTRGQGASTLTLGLHYGSQQAGDATLVVRGPTENLAQRGFDNTMSRYKIDGNEVWEFYNKPNFKDLLFTATGPIGWTRADSGDNDRVSSVKPVRREPPGEVGDMGDQGEVGAKGEQGDPGEIGDPGENDSCMSSDHISNICTLVGAKGEPGISGLPGVPGIKGVPGEPGEPSGESGRPGLPGGVGYKGRPGVSGERGSDGARGEKGLDGGEYCNPEKCVLKLGKCYARSTITLSVWCREGYAAASIWRNTKFWGLKCCQIVGSYTV